MVIILLICNIVIMSGLVLYIRYTHIKQEDIIEVLKGILRGESFKRDFYRDNRISEIYFLLKKINDRSMYLINVSDSEKDCIKQNISNMSHQLKTPLADVILYEELLDKEQLGKKEKESVKHRLKKQTCKIKWIMESIIKCTQLEEEAIRFDIASLPLFDTLIYAIDSVAGKANQKNIEFELHDFDEGIQVVHNKKWTAEVFENIFENAIKYSPENSQIDIKTEKMDAYTKIMIRDYGIGIRTAEQEKIFKRFYRSKDVENMEGSGLGLYLCRLILENEKGSITVKSQYGKGSEFCVMLKNGK